MTSFLKVLVYGFLIIVGTIVALKIAATFPIGAVFAFAGLLLVGLVVVVIGAACSVGALAVAFGALIAAIVLVVLCPVLIPILILCSPLVFAGLLVAGLAAVAN